MNFYDKLTQLLKHLKKINVKVFLGFLLIIFVLFLRLRTRIDHILTFGFTYYYFFLALSLMLIYGYFCYKLFAVTEKDNLLTQTKKKIIAYLYDSLDKVYQLIYPLITYVVDTYSKIILISFMRPRIRYIKTIYFLGFIFPRILISSALFCDVVYFHYMHYLYKIIWIIWLLMLFRITLYILKDWGKKLYEILTKHFDTKIYVEQVSDTEYKMKFIVNALKVSCEKLVFPRDKYYRYLSYYWPKFIVLEDQIEKESKKLWVKYLNLFIFGTFFFVWSYTVYKILEKSLFIEEAIKIITNLLKLLKK